MAVVATGVHLPRYGGRKGQAGGLLNGQGVGIAAKRDGVGFALIKVSADGALNG